jgi:adenosylhomocysteine nucleosidase
MQRIGIIGAMEPEVALLKQQLAQPSTEQVGPYQFYSGQLAGRDVVLVQSGIGKVAAALATSLMIQHFKVDAVINTGSAGGFDAELHIGDVVIGTELCHHDVDVTAFGYAPGQVPNMPVSFISDPVLVQAAERSIIKLGVCKTKQGLIATGDSFMCDPERIQATHVAFPSMLAVEMEGAAIAQVCYQMQVPCVVIRSLSDIAGKESPESFEAYLQVASKNSSAMVIELLQQLSAA